MLKSDMNLVVCQKSKIDDWVNHLTTHNPEYKIFDLTTQIEAFCAAITPRIGVINYDLLWRRPILLQYLHKFTLCLDESSLIQNESAKRTRFIMKMNPANVILLSGTPTAGKYETLWTQIHLLGWDISRMVYNMNYINWTMLNIGQHYPIKIVDKRRPYKNVDRLKSKLREHGAVFLKTNEVFDLPEQNFITVKVKTTPEYVKFRRDGIVTIGGETLVGDTILTKRLYARMLCGHYNPEKLEAFQDLCESTADRVIVFYNFDKELEALKRVAAKLNRPISEINGHVKDLTAYENEDNSITLVNYKAGAMGLNLQLANKMIFFTPPESCGDWQQALKRIHRIGQSRACFYYCLTCQNSIEEDIYGAIKRGVDFTNELFRETKF